MEKAGCGGNSAWLSCPLVLYTGLTGYGRGEGEEPCFLVFIAIHIDRTQKCSEMQNPTPYLDRWRQNLLGFSQCT